MTGRCTEPQTVHQSDEYVHDSEPIGYVLTTALRNVAICNKNHTR